MYYYMDRVWRDFFVHLQFVRKSNLVKYCYSHLIEEEAGQERMNGVPREKGVFLVQVWVGPRTLHFIKGWGS